MYKIYTYICIYIKDLFISPFVLFKRCFTTWRAFISLIKKPTISLQQLEPTTIPRVPLCLRGTVR